MARKSAIAEAIEAFQSLKKKMAQKKIGGAAKANGVPGVVISPEKVEPVHKMPTQEQINRLKILRKNVLDQYNFSPQARSRIGRLPVMIDSIINANNFGSYSHPSRQNEHIQINRNIFNERDKFLPTEVLAHEYMHSLDSSAHQYPTNYPGSSQGFYNRINAPRSTMNDPYQINSFVRRYPEDDRIKNIEGFAQQGALEGQNNLLGPNVDYFQDMFIPATPRLNYSPIYPTRQIYSYSLNQLFGEQ